MFKNFKFHPIPKLPLLLGVTGLFPFIIFAFLIVSDSPNNLSLVLKWTKYYSAVILSFITAFLWCFSMTLNLSKKINIFFYLWSVFVTIICWASFSITARISITILLIFFLLQFLIEFLFLPKNLPNRWYIGFRAILTTGIVLCNLFIVLISWNV